MNVISVGGDNLVDSNTNGNQDTSASSVALMWGIADTTASVGRMFRYHIPGDAFKGSVQKYEVVEAGKTSLPSWLQFLPDQNVLQGIPQKENAGTLYLEVLAHGSDGSQATDVFSVSISGDAATLSLGQPLTFKKGGPEVVRCKREEPETVATIIIDADLGGMPVDDQMHLLSKFLSHMGLVEEVAKMVPVVNANPLQDDTALVTGTGDAVQPQFSGVQVSWLVGCGKVEPGHFPVLQKLDDDSTNGLIKRAVGHSIVGWRVTNSRLQQQAPKRRRRQARGTPTPVITTSPSTATDAMTDTDVTGVDTMTRKVVDMTSPTFTIQPTATEPVMPKTMTTEMPTTTTPRPKTPKPTKPRPPTDTPVTPPKVTKAPTTTTTTTPQPKPKPTMEPTLPPPERPECQRVIIGEELPRVNVMVGEILEFAVPDNTFINPCGMGKIKLILFKGTSAKIEEDDWVQFDETTHTILTNPSAEHEGRHPFTLVASINNYTTFTPLTFRINVKEPSGRKSKINHEVAMTIDADYDKFSKNLTAKVDLARKIAGAFGDENTSAMTVTSISKGSVIFAWTNNSIAGGGCPVDDAKAMAGKLVTEDGRLSPDTVKKLKPWKLTGAALQPAGDCEDDPNFPAVSATVAPAPTDRTPASTTMPDVKTMAPKTDKPMPPKPTTPASNQTTEAVAKGAKTSEDDIWITTVVPAVVIVAILLIALLIACILYRKKRKGKMNLEDQNTFVNKGAPVIFPDELDDKPSDSTKPLLIEGSPPAPPPEYHRGASESPEPRNNHKESTPPTDEVDAEVETDVTSPLYQPPPPVTASTGKSARPHVQQPYRSQPPEIHP